MSIGLILLIGMAGVALLVQWLAMTESGNRLEALAVIAIEVVAGLTGLTKSGLL